MSQATFAVTAPATTVPNYPLFAGWVGECIAATPGSKAWANRALALVTADSLTQTQYNAILGNNANCYVALSQNAVATRIGTTASGLTVKNRMTVDSYEPGSTFKIVSIGAALNEGLATLGERVDCERGTWFYKGKPLRDHDPLGVLSVEEVMMKSSNIGSAKIGLRLGDDGLFRYLTAFGFGERTGVLLPGESRGQLIPLKKWDGITGSRVSIGHSAAATPLQMAMAMAAIANGGKLMRPLLLDRLEDAEGKVVLKNQPQLVRQVFKPEISKQVVETLKRVVSTDGTAEKARLGYYTAAGKTGTAQKLVNGEYSHSKYFSSFIGFFPADNPELLIYVAVDEPDKAKGFYGGQVAAPAFKNIALRAANYLNIRPETAVGEPVTGLAQAPLANNRTN